jgi:hypothetical protein
MKPPEEVKLEFTREWVQKAEGDFKTASLLLEAGRSQYRLQPESAWLFRLKAGLRTSYPM